MGLTSNLCLLQEEAAAVAAALGVAAPVTQGGQGVSAGIGCVLSGESAARMTQGLPPLEKVCQHWQSEMAQGACRQLYRTWVESADCMGCPAAAAVCIEACLCSHAMGLALLEK